MTKAAAQLLARRMTLLGVPAAEAARFVTGKPMRCADGNTFTASRAMVARPTLTTAEWAARIFRNYRRPHIA